MKKSKREQGITLIALIITIIVLLILALVTINAIQGDDSLIVYANNAKTMYTTEGENENAIIGNYIDYMDSIFGENKQEESNILKKNVVYSRFKDFGKDCFVFDDDFVYIAYYEENMTYLDPVKVPIDEFDPVTVSNNGNTIVVNEITYTYDSSIDAGLLKEYVNDNFEEEEE